MCAVVHKVSGVPDVCSRYGLGHCLVHPYCFAAERVVDYFGNHVWSIAK